MKRWQQSIYPYVHNNQLLIGDWYLDAGSVLLQGHGVNYLNWLNWLTFNAIDGIVLTALCWLLYLKTDYSSRLMKKKIHLTSISYPFPAAVPATEQVLFCQQLLLYRNSVCLFSCCCCFVVVVAVLLSFFFSILYISVDVLYIYRRRLYIYKGCFCFQRQPFRFFFIFHIQDVDAPKYS